MMMVPFLHGKMISCLEYTALPFMREYRFPIQGKEQGILRRRMLLQPGTGCQGNHGKPDFIILNEILIYNLPVSIGYQVL